MGRLEGDHRPELLSFLYDDRAISLSRNGPGPALELDGVSGHTDLVLDRQIDETPSISKTDFSTERPNSASYAVNEEVAMKTSAVAR